MTMQSVREKYGVPARRGMHVRYGDLDGIIQSADSLDHLRIYVDDPHYCQFIVHPFDLIYHTPDGWVNGETLRKKYDAAIDEWNLALNLTVQVQQKLNALIDDLNKIPGVKASASAGYMLTGGTR